MKAGKKKKSLHRVYTDETPVTVYKLAKAGLGDMKIALALGVDYQTFAKWKKKRSAVRYALEEGRKSDKEGSESFQEYLFNRLPPELQSVWDEILRVEEDGNNRQSGNAIARLETLLTDSGKKGRQHLFLHALFHHNFNLSEACRSVNISRKTFDRWMLTDPLFAELLEEMEWHKKNYFEGSLIQLVKNGDPAAIMFVAKTYNADRGYGSKKTIDKNVNVNVSGGIQVGHAVVPLEELGLSLKERQKLLSRVREVKAKELPEKGGNA